MSPWIPKNQKITINVTITVIEGNVFAADKIGLKITKTKFVKPDPVIDVTIKSNPINKTVLTIIGIYTSNGPVTIGGTPSGI